MTGAEAAAVLPGALRSGNRDLAWDAAWTLGQVALQGYCPALNDEAADVAWSGYLRRAKALLDSGRLDPAKGPAGMLAVAARRAAQDALRQQARRLARETRYAAEQLDNPTPDPLQYDGGRRRPRGWL